MMRFLIGAFVVLCLSLGHAGRAQEAPSPPTSSPSAVPHPAATGVPGSVGLDCRRGIPSTLASGDMKLVVALDRSTIWQPRGGEIRFTITGSNGISLDRMGLVVCFRWRRGEGGANWVQSPLPLRVVSIAPGAMTLGARVPALPDAAPGWLSRIGAGADGQEYAGLWIVPLADFRVLAASPAWGELDVVFPVGVTSLWYSTVVSVLSVSVAGGVLFHLARLRGVPGSGNVVSDAVLRIISTGSGHASLSQFQMLLWSFVVGGCAIYVMALSGSLVEITEGTLVLLGIAGVATLGSKLQGGVQNLALDGARAQSAPVPAAEPGRDSGPVAATDGKGQGPRTDAGGLGAGSRGPRWSDLIVTDDGQDTVDVTRVQMLFFTVIIAVFVVMKILTSGEFPTIPQSFLLLMGISNGVYITSKFIPERR